MTLFRAAVSPPACRILDAMVWLESGRIPMPWHRSLVAYSANHLPRSGGFKGYLAKLKALELIYYSGGGLTLEHEGRRLARQPPVTFSRERYWEVLEGHLGPLDRAICKTVREIPITRDALDQAVVGHGDTTSFANSIAKLLAVGLVELEDGVFSRTEVLYPLSVFERRLADDFGLP